MKVQNHNKQPAARSGRSGMHWMMWVCCTVMVLPLVFFIANGGSLKNPGALLTAVLPIGLCVGAHFLLHRLVGQSCALNQSGKNENEVAAAIPQHADKDTQKGKIA